ncbi:hypothetical protein CENSYa_1084 [Cenarchaeum symbiosum A]|uniref:Uncharacterized protein n=1 Tax=Cenarchaeum symbiosum (strain A) TaxID=414004 RepID=A0RWJ6_CENSY|nr:hypothetical protein CENSYa_1084 [Cenarchaeum symbiosum A]
MDVDGRVKIASFDDDISKIPSWGIPISLNHMIKGVLFYPIILPRKLSVERKIIISAGDVLMTPDDTSEIYQLATPDYIAGINNIAVALEDIDDLDKTHADPRIFGVQDSGARITVNVYDNKPCVDGALLKNDERGTLCPLVEGDNKDKAVARYIPFIDNETKENHIMREYNKTQFSTPCTRVVELL